MSVVGGPRPESIFNRFSFQFDGTDDYINLGNTSISNGGTELTVSTWINTTDVTATQTIFSNFFGKNYVEMTLISGGLYCWIGDGTTTSNYNVVNSTNLAIANDTWYNIIMVFDGSQATNGTRLKAYKDSNLLTWSTIRTIPTTLGTLTTDTFIGTRSSTPSSTFSGKIDEVAFWHSLPDVSTIYNSGVPNDLSSLSSLGWWRMGDKANFSGGVWTLTDQGSGGNDGTSNGMGENNRVLDTP